MKKLISIIISVIMIFLLTTCGFAAENTPASVSIKVDEDFTNPTVTSSKNVVSGLYSMINTAKRGSLKPSQVTEFAWLNFDGYTFNNKTYGEEYTIYKASDGSLYTMKNNRLYKIDADTFYSLADESDIGFYKYRRIPTAKLGSLNLPINASSYKFKKLDGIFYTTRFEPDDWLFSEEDGGSIPTPEFSAKPKSVKVTVTYNDGKADSQVVWSGDISEIRNFKPEKSGGYAVRYIAEYESPYYSGEVVYRYDPHYSVGISFIVEGLGRNESGVTTAPGEVVVLRAFNIPENSKVTVKSDISFTPAFFRRAHGDMAALMPISYYTAAGSRYVELSCDGVTQRFTLDVKAGNFVEQHLTVPPETTEATINSQKANDEFEKAIAPIRYVSDDKQYWSGRFIWPLKELPRRTTEFGSIRYTNGDMKNPSRHGAIDFAAPAGTPVYAPAAGRVLYSGNLQLTGNTICIEHGYGLKTWYYHMNGRNVKTGDMVKQGQQIGIVGSTGFSTGAHLHYGMSVSNTTSGNVFINPETSVATDLLFISDASHG